MSKRKNVVRALFKLLSSSDPTVEGVQALIDKYPDALKEKDAAGRLPLHAAVENGASVEVTQLLSKEYPDAVKKKDRDGDLPLHATFRNGASMEVVQLLIKEYPDAVKEKNENGYLPLYEAVYHSASVEVVQLLIKEYPHAVREKDKDEYLPLHIAARNGASVEVVQQLLEEYPDAVKEKTKYGRLPLQNAVCYGASMEVIQLLIQEYPDAVKEKDEDGKLPLDLAARNHVSEEVSKLLIKKYVDAVNEEGGEGGDEMEIYERVVTGVDDSTRSKGFLGDHAKGKDLLGVKEEAQAIADTIAFKDLQPPFVVGILGGWGSGKSFTFNLIEEQLKEIQKFNLAKEVVKLKSLYVGHIYLIKFDVWTFAKGCLWSSLMNRILTELNDQLDLESVIGPELLKEGVSVIELMNEFSTIGEFKYLKEVMKDKTVQKRIGEWKPRSGNITQALINATNSNYDDEVKELAEKKQQLQEITLKKKQQLAWEDVTADFNTTFLPEIKELLKGAYKQYADENPDDPVPQTVDAAIFSKCCYGWLKILWAGRLSPLWFVVFLSSLVLAVVLPLVLDKVGAIATAIGPLLSGIVLKYLDARAKLRSAQAVITEVASEMNLDKEQLQEALEAANNAQLRSDTNDEEKQLDIIRDLNADINSLEERVWLRKGDSLNKVIADRVGSNNYEEHLGVVHQAQKDLQHISDAMLSRDDNEKDAAKKIFPRGDPRIVLFIDDLDRCPPKKVVETLEAVQLLVKTKLFVVVLAIDAQYVTLCLEKEYKDILRQERHPSGLDYIEKIVQLPYRVPPISAEYMRSYLQAQMMAEDDDSREDSGQNSSQVLQEERNVEEEDSREVSAGDDVCVTQEGSSSASEKTNVEEEDSREVSAGDDVRVTQEGSSSASSAESGSHDDNTNEGVPEEPTMTETAQSGSKAVLLPTEELDFTWEELESLEKACVFSGVDPRSSKRLVNVFKLMKNIWYRRDQTQEVSIKEACILILALSASNSKSMRQRMCKVLTKIERTSSMPTDCDNLKDFIEQALSETKIKSEICIEIFEKVKWIDDEEWNLVKNDLRLLRCFSFLGEYNGSEEDIHRGL